MKQLKQNGHENHHDAPEYLENLEVSSDESDGEDEFVSNGKVVVLLLRSLETIYGPFSDSNRAAVGIIGLN